MGFISNLFSDKKQTQQLQNQSSTNTSKSNYWDDPSLQNFLSGYNQQYSGPNISQVQADPNQYQYGAANNQTGLNAGLQPAFGAANNIAGQGFTTADIQAKMSPYIQSVVNPTIAAQNLQNQQALQNIQGNQAARGALGNSNNANAKALYYQATQPGQTAQIAGLYNTGYGQATDAAARDAALRLQGAGTAGSLTGVASGVNTGQANIGEMIRQAQLQSQMTPFQLYNQGLQGQQLAGNL